WSYVEIVCSYFDDVLADENYDRLVARGLVSVQETAIVKPLHELLERHEAPGGDEWNAQRILADPAWLAITDKAKATNLQLAALLNERAEKDVLLKPIAD